MRFIARKLQTYTAWQYKRDIDIPIWVARKCHYLGDGKFTANTAMGLMEIIEGDYVVLLEDGQPEIVIVKAEQFEADYEPARD